MKIGIAIMAFLLALWGASVAFEHFTAVAPPTSEEARKFLDEKHAKDFETLSLSETKGALTKGFFVDTTYRMNFRAEVRYLRFMEGVPDFSGQLPPDSGDMGTVEGGLFFKMDEGGRWREEQTDYVMKKMGDDPPA